MLLMKTKPFLRSQLSLAGQFVVIPDAAQRLKLVESDDWQLVRTRSRATHRKTLTPRRRLYAETSGVEEMKYAVLYEPTATGYSAHVPDLPECIGAAPTPDEERELMKEAVEGHLECMWEFGYAIPEPTTVAEEVDVSA